LGDSRGCLVILVDLINSRSNGLFCHVEKRLIELEMSA
jgi:hypothetical protein